MAENLTDTLKARVAAIITQHLVQYADRIATVIQTNPLGSIAALQARPDIAQSLAASLEASRQAASSAVSQAWQASGAPESVTLQSLLDDVGKAYDEAPGRITQAVDQAWHSVPDAAPFVPGVSVPGTTPATDTAAARAQAVRSALSGQGEALALRNGMSVSGASSWGETEALLADAQARSGEKLGKKWVSRLSPRTCAWCRALHGVVVPIDENFPHPAAIGGKKGPAVYLGHLHGPQLHPNCECRLEIVPLAEPDLEPLPEEQPAGPQPTFVTSTQIQALPEDRYQSLLGFIRAAIHELGQLIRRIVGL